MRYLGARRGTRGERCEHGVLRELAHQHLTHVVEPLRRQLTDEVLESSVDLATQERLGRNRTREQLRAVAPAAANDTRRVYRVASCYVLERRNWLFHKVKCSPKAPDGRVRT